MATHPTRRRFLASSAAAALGACAAPRSAVDPGPPKTLDIHVHLFGGGDAGSGCHLSDEIRRGLNFMVLSRMLGLHRRGLGLDRGYAEALAEQLATSPVDLHAVLAQDRVYDRNGRPDMDRTHFYVPNDYLFEFVDRHPNKAVPCVSINPDRRDRIDELERCVARGARLLKVHPPTQIVDIADPRHLPFFRRCAELDVLVLVHTGHEHAAPVADITLADPRRMIPALEAGCRMVACHAGSGWQNDRPDWFPEFVALTRRYENLWGDTSVMATAARKHDLERALDEQGLAARLVHGSDFPFPAWPVAFGDRIGRERALALQQEPNLIARDFGLKQALGIAGATAAQGHRLVFPDGRPPA